MKTFVVWEGESKNDNALDTNFRKLERAIEYAKKSKYHYAVVMEYDGDNDDKLANYRATHFEKGLNK
jgi:hypothetical protein